MDDTIKYVLAAGATSIVTKTSVAPLERIKMLKQTNGTTHKYSNMALTCIIKNIYKEDGIKGFYKGNGSNIVRCLPVYTIKFTVNDKIRQFMLKPGQTVRDLTFKQAIIAGFISGFVQDIVTYPLDLIRTRIATSNVTYNGIAHCIKSTIQNEGFRGLYKGLPVSIITCTPYVGLQMSLYDYFKNTISIDNNTTKSLLSGAMAGIVAQTITYPGDTIKRQMQLNGSDVNIATYRSCTHCFKQIYKREGIAGLYRGLHLNMIRCMPEVAIQMWAYDWFKKQLKLNHTVV